MVVYPEKEMRVKKIQRGTVIDHIPKGQALNVMKILNLAEHPDPVTIAINVESGKHGQKDIIKVENRELSPGEVDKIALIAPYATINIIRDYKVVEKKQVSLPREIHGIVRCANPNCITNSREPAKTGFTIEKATPLLLRCKYCDRTMSQQDVIDQF